MQQSKIMGIILVTAVSMVVATLIGPLNVHLVYADANCAKADNTDNPSGNFKGNSKHAVSTLTIKDLKPIRNCDSPNAPKNNDGDASASCKFRGNN